jgi:high affinity Mn2+ porin
MKSFYFHYSSLLLLLLSGAAPLHLLAQKSDSLFTLPAESKPPPRANLHFQTTYIYQYKPQFNAPYSGPNSLLSSEEKENSLTATLYLGVRLWRGAEIYINPEIAGGSGLSGAFGLSASTNGETFRIGDPAPALYLGRGYLKQTFAFGKDNDAIEDLPNQLANKIEPRNYLRFLLGKFSLGDFFDNNAYANSPRTQFMNWCLMSNGAYDYAANVRGYTYAFAAILQYGSMNYKAALTTLPVTANGADLNTNLNQEYSINAEISRQWKIKYVAGNVRLLGYYNNGHMGNYKTALQNRDSGIVPNIIDTRKYGREKKGLGINADMQLTKTTGVFARAGWNDGTTETWAFTEADRSLSAGLSFNGAKWKRKDDNLGVAMVVNGLSKPHHDYLTAGGLGFQLGDGTMHYANETAVELYYSCKPVATGIWLTADYQFILNPGYNSDRGPVNVFSFRVHVEL